MDEQFEPKLIGILCNWCSYMAADLVGTSRIRYAPNIRIIRVMCSGRIESQLILWAFRSGADGVLIGGCNPGDCHYQEGNYKALRRVTLLKQMLPQFGIEPERLRLDWICASCAEEMRKTVEGFTAQIRNLGPLRLQTPPLLKPIKIEMEVSRHVEA